MKRIRPKKGYKVVEVYKGGLFSLYETGRGGVKYELEKFVKPNPDCGPLTVLKSYKSGSHLIDNCSRFPVALYECEYIPSEKKCVWVYPHTPILLEKLEQNNPTTLIPGETVLADKVKLTKIRKGN